MGEKLTSEAESRKAGNFKFALVYKAFRNSHLTSGRKCQRVTPETSGLLKSGRQPTFFARHERR
jgi:hypothetical protein